MKPSLPKEARNVAGLGEVVIRSMTFSQRTAYDDKYVECYGADVRKAIAENRADDVGELLASRREQFAALAPYLLSMCVIGGDGKPVMTADEWDAWGAGKNRKVCASLHSAAYALSGLDLDDAEKKSETDPA